MEEFKLALMDKNDFKNLNANTENNFGTLGPSRVGNGEKTYALRW